MLEYLGRQAERQNSVKEAEKQADLEWKTGKEITAAMVVHGGTIMSLLSFYGEGDYFDYQTANGSGYSCRLEIKDGAPRFLNIIKMQT